jgi:hypothetical protein
MDESYHELKTSILRQVGAMQIMDREKMVQVQTQNEDLTPRLAAAEEDRMKMSKVHWVSEFDACETDYTAHGKDAKAFIPTIQMLRYLSNLCLVFTDVVVKN